MGLKCEPWQVLETESPAAAALRAAILSASSGPSGQEGVGGSTRTASGHSSRPVSGQSARPVHSYLTEGVYQVVLQKLNSSTNPSSYPLL